MTNQPEAAAIERLAKKYAKTGNDLTYLAWEEKLLTKALTEAYSLGISQAKKRCAEIAGGWSGEVNTVENAAVVSEVCRQIAHAIRREEI